jgi:hypothetical protein
MCAINMCAINMCAINLCAINLCAVKPGSGSYYQGGCHLGGSGKVWRW